VVVKGKILHCADQATSMLGKITQVTFDLIDWFHVSSEKYQHQRQNLQQHGVGVGVGGLFLRGVGFLRTLGIEVGFGVGFF